MIARNETLARSGPLYDASNLSPEMLPSWDEVSAQMFQGLPHDDLYEAVYSYFCWKLRADDPDDVDCLRDVVQDWEGVCGYAWREFENVLRAVIRPMNDKDIFWALAENLTPAILGEFEEKFDRFMDFVDAEARKREIYDGLCHDLFAVKRKLVALHDSALICMTICAVYKKRGFSLTKDEAFVAVDDSARKAMGAFFDPAMGDAGRSDEVVIAVSGSHECEVTLAELFCDVPDLDIVDALMNRLEDRMGESRQEILRAIKSKRAGEATNDGEDQKSALSINEQGAIRDEWLKYKEMPLEEIGENLIERRRGEKRCLAEFILICGEREIYKGKTLKALLEREKKHGEENLVGALGRILDRARHWDQHK